MSCPRPLVLCGPSGSGKSTLLKELMKEFESCFGFSISHTTRKPRPGEINGREYHFVDLEQMKAAVANGEFIESAIYSGNLYGTSKKAVADVSKSGKICVLDIDVQGVKSIKNSDLNPKYVFIMPPSLEALGCDWSNIFLNLSMTLIILKEHRLRARGTETEESLAKRLEISKAEFAYANEPGNFDKIIINDEVDRAYAELRDFMIEDINKIVTEKS